MRRRGEQARQHPERRAGFGDAVDPYARFEDLVAGALDTLPPAVQGLLENVAIVIEDEPKKLYLQFTMSVVVERVVADVREHDGIVRVAPIAEPPDGAPIETGHAGGRRAWTGVIL